MLISRRREGESIQIGDGIEIRIVTVRKNKVVVGIIAPREVKIAAGKLTEEALANTVAALNSSNLGHFLPTPSWGGEAVLSLLSAKDRVTEQSAAVDDKARKDPHG